MGSIAEFKEEGDEVCEVERKTASILCENEDSSGSKESSTVTNTSTSTNSSSSSSTDVTDCVFSDEHNEHIINGKNESVYFDGDQESSESGEDVVMCCCFMNKGIWKCHHCEWTLKEESIFCFDPKVSESSGATAAIESPKHLVDEWDTDNKQPCEIEETKEEEEEEEIQAVDQDYDVEKVLENQETHDLYCPNCNSCITKRVLVKRRKRMIPHVLAEPKRFRGLTAHEPLHSDDNLPLLDEKTVRESSIWQCLSCFSIFIPKGSSPKLVPSDKGEEEIKTLPKPQKSVYSKRFDFKWKRTVVDQGGETPSLPQININSPAENTSDPLESRVISKTLPAENVAEPFSSEEPLKLQVPPPQEDIDTTLIQGIYMSLDPPLVEQSQLNNKKDESNAVEENQLSGKGCLSPIQPSLDINSLSKESVEDTELVSPENGDSERTNVSDTSVISAIEPNEIRVEITPSSSLKEPLVTPRTGKGYKLDILKSIVYGGLIESITILGVISSAAGSGASTLTIFVLGLANLVGGLILIVHNLQELKEENPIRTTNEENQINDQEDRYMKLLGRRQNFRLHETFAILSFIIFGLIPPVVYCFAFNKTDKREYKAASVLASSLLCIGLLAIGKAHVKTPRDSYLKSVFYYVTIAFSASGISYVVGDFMSQMIEKYGWPEGSETPAEMMMRIPVMGRKAGFGVPSYTM